jgi:addiction module HigA family antidote
MMVMELTATAAPVMAPAHPGRVLKEDVLPGIRMTKRAFAKHLGISRQTLFELIGERRALTVDMAGRLGKALGTGSKFWLNLQAGHDAWHVDRSPAVAGITRIEGRTRVAA